MVCIPVFVKKAQMPGFGTHLTYLKQDTRHNATHVYFLSKGVAKLGFISFFVLFHYVTKSFIVILKIRTKSFYT